MTTLVEYMIVVGADNRPPMQDKAKESCMGGFERAFATLFDQDVQTFTGTIRSGNDTHAENANIKPVNDKEPMAEHFQLAYYSVGQSKSQFDLWLKKAQEKDKIESKPDKNRKLFVGNKMHKAFPLPGESSHWQYKFPLPVEGVPTARRMRIPLPGVCTAMIKKLPVKDKWQLH
nr:hypothetical protein [Tanacetum cinerariifolium]